MKKVIFALTLALSFVLLLSGCGRYVSKYDESYVYDGESLIGKWQESEHDDEFYQVYNFTSKTDVTLTSYSYGIVMQEIVATYRVENDNTLVVEWGDGFVNKNDFSISKDGYLTITQVLEAEHNEMVLEPYSLDWNTKNDIKGTWISSDYKNEAFTFSASFVLTVEGETDTYKMPYAVSGDKLAFGGEFVDGFKEKVNVMTYKIDGDTLTLTGKGENGESVILTFTREK
jgi:hypothetical protein